MNSQKKLILLGFSSGSVPVITELADEIESIRNFDIVKNVEVDQSKQPYHFPEYNIKSYSDQDYGPDNFESNPVHFGVLHSHIKYVLFDHFYKKFGIKKGKYIRLIHQSAYVAKSSEIADGVLIEPLTVVQCFTSVGFGVTIKRSSSVGHHCKLGDYVNLNPGVVISGSVTIGEGTEVGSGVTVTNDVSIGRHCLIGAGSVVVKDIPDGVIAYGNPCRVIRKNERWEKAKQLVV